jgi:putative protein-disulfide isomerase
MGGLLPSWNAFNDGTNNVTRPIQMGPVWMHAAQLSGMHMNTRIWMEDPPASSYPACIAVKCAMLQSKDAGESYLRALREAVMLGGLNISRQEILDQVAEALALERPGTLDMAAYYNDLETGKGMEAFRLDMNQVRLLNISRFPTLVIKSPGSGAIMVTGYRDYQALLAAIHHVAPNLEKTNTGYHPDNYSSFWHGVTTRELDELLPEKVR